MPATEADELHQGDVDAFIARNRDALNESIRSSRAEMDKGIKSTCTIGNIIDDGRRHFPEHLRR